MYLRTCDNRTEPYTQVRSLQSKYLISKDTIADKLDRWRKGEIPGDVSSAARRALNQIDAVESGEIQTR